VTADCLVVTAGGQVDATTAEPDCQTVDLQTGETVQFSRWV